MRTAIKPDITSDRPDDVFPPQTTRADQVEAVIELLRGVIPGRFAIYVSSPITSGRRFVEWYERHGQKSGSADFDHAAHFQHVVEPNRAAAAALVRKARELNRGFVIDPTAVGVIEGWNQGD